MPARLLSILTALVLGLLLPSTGNAVVTNTLPAGVLVSPNTYTAVRSSDQSNVDIGSQNPANVETKLESSAWFNTELTFVGGGACGTSPNFANGCSAFDDGPTDKGGSSQFEGNVFGIHYGNNFIAVLYGDLVSGFSIDGLGNGVSNIYVFKTVSQVPLPAALPLFFSALAMLGLGGWYRRRQTA
jgi:hypothetical protein